MLHQKADGIATAAATKALVNFFGGRNGERGGFFVVKRAQTEVVHAPLFQLHETAYDINDINATLDLLYGVLCDQALLDAGLIGNCSICII